MELWDTKELMLSKDYKERFLAEYFQLKIRRNKLKEMIEKMKNNTLDFRPDCPLRIYDFQIECMDRYLSVLEDRAYIEKIDLKAAWDEYSKKGDWA